MVSCRIIIVDKREIIDKTMQQMDLMGRECRTRPGHHILYAALMHGDDIGLSLDDESHALTVDGLLGLIEAIQLMVLMEDVAVGRVDIFLLHTLCALVKHTGRETHHLTGRVHPRKDDPSGIAVDKLAPVILIAQPDLPDELTLIAFLLGLTGKGMTVSNIISQMELPDNVVPKATRAIVLHADGHTVSMMMEQVLK